MTRVLLLAVLAWAAGPLAGQEPGAESGAPPADPMALVARAVAERWGVPPLQVVLDGAPPAGSDLDGASFADLRGSGRNGYWIVAFREAQGEEILQQIQIRAGVQEWIPVAVRPLEQGHLLTEEDMAWESRVVWGDPRGGPRTALPGWMVKRVLARGTPLLEPGVAPAPVVRSGDPVTVEWISGRVRISVAGVAQGTVPEGREVFVRTELGTRLRGVAAGPGLIRIVNAPQGSESVGETDAQRP